jgi:hypothetical protein
LSEGFPRNLHAFRAVFHTFSGPQRSRVAAKQLKTAGFLDKQSKVLSIKFGSMHSASSLFSFVNIEFAMNAAGMFSDNSIEIQSVRLEPYVLESNVSDRILLTCEVCCSLSTLRFSLKSLPSDFFHDLAWQILLGLRVGSLAQCPRARIQSNLEVLDCGGLS